MTDVCECNEEYGPCEAHADYLFIREGASTRTGDELMAQFIADCLAIDSSCLSPQGHAWLKEAEVALEAGRDPVSGVAWISEDDDDKRENLAELARQVEAYFADLYVTWEDGYVITRVVGGPLASATGGEA